MPQVLRAFVLVTAVLGALAGVWSWSLGGEGPIAVGQFICLFSAVIGVVALAFLPNTTGSRQRAALAEIDAAFASRRFVHTLELVTQARARWLGWEQGDTYANFSLVALWRIDEALLWYETAWTAKLHTFTKRWAAQRALFIAELAGRGAPWRARADELQLTEHQRALAEFVRAAREGNFARVRELHPNLDAIPPVLQPLVAAIHSMANEHTNPQPIDKATLLGETGVEQVEKVWPALADFIRRAPPV